jgi:uncharacterized protein YdaT
MKSVKINLKQTDKVKSYNQALKLGLQNRHVIKQNGAWVVKKIESQRASASFGTQSEAINWAKERAVNSGASVVVHS